MLSEQAEEILEALWIHIEEQGNKPIAKSNRNPQITNTKYQTNNSWIGAVRKKD